MKRVIRDVFPTVFRQPLTIVPLAVTLARL